MEYVWLVYEHDYGESHVHGIFNSLEKAEAYVNETLGEVPVYQRPHLEIQTWEINVPTRT